MNGYVHMIVAIGCLAILYPKLLHPLLFSHLFSTQDNGKVTYEKVINKEELDPKLEQQLNMHASIRGKNFAPKIPLNKAEPRHAIQPKSSNAGTLAIMLPVYGAGIAFYLIYTLAKVFGGKTRKYQDKKRAFLKEHYRNFHYDVERKEFRMGVTVPNDLAGLIPEVDEEEGRTHIFSSDDGIKRFGDCMNNNPTVSTNPTFNMESCALVENDLDLDQIIHKEVNEITDSELICLKQKLVETEQNLARILETMNRIENQKLVNTADTSFNSNSETITIEEIDSDENLYEEESENNSLNEEDQEDSDCEETPSATNSSTELESNPSGADTEEDIIEEECNSSSSASEDYSSESDEEATEDVRYRGPNDA